MAKETQSSRRRDECLLAATVPEPVLGALRRFAAEHGLTMRQVIFTALEAERESLERVMALGAAAALHPPLRDRRNSESVRWSVWLPLVSVTRLDAAMVRAVDERLDSRAGALTVLLLGLHEVGFARAYSTASDEARRRAVAADETVPASVQGGGSK